MGANAKDLKDLFLELVEVAEWLRALTLSAEEASALLDLWRTCCCSALLAQADRVLAALHARHQRLHAAHVRARARHLAHLPRPAAPRPRRQLRVCARYRARTVVVRLWVV